MRAVATGVLLAVGLGAALPAAVSAQDANPTFDRVVELVEERFYDPAALPAFRRSVAAVVAATPDLGREDAGPVVGEAIDAVLASLQASHTARYTPDELDYYELADIFRFALRRAGRRLFPPEGRPSYAGIGIATEVIDGRTFVSDVYDGAPADRAGLIVGDEIIAVDGGSFSQIGSFQGKEGRTVSVSIRRAAGGEPLTVAVRVEQLRPTATFVEAVSSSVRVVSAGNRRIGIVRLWSYTTDEVAEVLREAIAEGALRGADGLVLDLRSRWGGAPADAAEMFVGRSADMTMTYRDGDTRSVNTHWRKPLVAVIDEGTRSGMELLAFSLKRNGVPLVGAPTAGDVLAGSAFLLPDDSLLILAVADVHVDGTRLEANPVEPDIPVSFDIRYADGRDPQLDAALAEMARILADSDGTN